MGAKPSSDVAEMRELLVWARKEGIVLGAVSIGACSVTVVDLGVYRDKKPGGQPRKPSFLQTMAGSRAAEMAEAGIIPPLEDDGEEAAVQ